MPPVGFELTISAGERPQTYTLDRAAGQWDQKLNNLPQFIFEHYISCGSFKSVFGDALYTQPIEKSIITKSQVTPFVSKLTLRLLI